jgi:hypothetical protein
LLSCFLTLLTQNDTILPHLFGTDLIYLQEQDLQATEQALTQANFYQVKKKKHLVPAGDIFMEEISRQSQ